MKKIRFAVVGSGWRSLYYIRIAKALPEQFELCTLLCRTQEKADHIHADWQIPTTCIESDVYALNPDFIVSAVNRDSMYNVALHWMELGFPVLSETPPSMKPEDLSHLWELRKQHTGPISSFTGRPADYRMQVAEQYFCYPTHEARTKIIQSGLLGDPVSMTISYMHDYHAASLIRRMLHTDFEDVSVIGSKYTLPVTDTRTRYEVLTEGKVVNKDQAHLVLEYANGKVAFYDFLSDQYRSPIRTRYLNVRGTRGELINDTVHYLNEQNLPETDHLRITQDPLTGEILAIAFRGQTLYTPPFGPCGLPEDETAIARILLAMAQYLENGSEYYPLAEALEDAEIAIHMTTAADHPWQMQHSDASRPWRTPVKIP